MALKVWTGSAYVDANLPKVNASNTPVAAWIWNGSAFVKVWPVGNDKIETLVEGFASQDGTKWRYQGAAAAVAGQLQLPLTSGYTNLIDTYTKKDYDLTGSSIFVEAASMPAFGNGTKEILLELQADSNNLLAMLVSSSSLWFRDKVAGTTNQTSITFDPAVHRWWRIRESGGTIYWDTSSNAVNWTNRFSKAVGIAITALKAVLSSGFYGGEPTPGTAILDNVNFAPAKVSFIEDFTTALNPGWTNFAASGGTNVNSQQASGIAGTKVLSSTQSTNTYQVYANVLPAYDDCFLDVTLAAPLFGTLDTLGGGSALYFRLRAQTAWNVGSSIEFLMRGDGSMAITNFGGGGGAQRATVTGKTYSAGQVLRYQAVGRVYAVYNKTTDPGFTTPLITWNDNTMLTTVGAGNRSMTMAQTANFPFAQSQRGCYAVERLEYGEL